MQCSTVQYSTVLLFRLNDEVKLSLLAFHQKCIKKQEHFVTLGCGKILTMRRQSDYTLRSFVFAVETTLKLQALQYKVIIPSVKLPVQLGII